ncbi:hypothetical protein ABK040_004713 [Willaertia magna]
MSNSSSSTQPPQRLSRDEYKKQQLLEEARKNGLVMPEKDEKGRDINPHIPQYIKQAPWYLDKGVPSLDHQRFTSPDDYSTLLNDEWYIRGVKSKQIVTKYRKGACTNCGAMTHKTKDCTERPRRKGAALTNKDICADEVVQNIKVDNYDAKRDPYNGYNPENYSKQVIQSFQLLEEERKRIKEKELHEKMLKKKEEEEKRQLEQTNENLNNNTTSNDNTNDNKTKEDGDSEDDSDDKEYFSSSDSGDEDLEGHGRDVKKIDPKVKSISQTLRSRHDIPKYLYNLDLDSAHYDPKTRSMRGNPLPFVDQSEVTYKGDNANKKTGEYQEFIQAQKFMYDAAKRGEDINLSAVPSQAYLAFQNFKSKKKELENAKRKANIEKYGGEKFLNKPEEFESAQIEQFTLYSTTGKVLAARSKAIPKSKYEEDVYYNGHTSVFGSYWDSVKGWGFSCCKQCDRKCYCKNLKDGSVASSSSTTKDVIIDTKENDIDNGLNTNNREISSDLSYQSEDDNKKKRKKEKKEKSNSKKLKSFEEVTEEEMEAYRKSKVHFEDPMKNFNQ